MSVDERCKFDGSPYELWLFTHCQLCGYVKMLTPDADGNARWQPIDGENK